MERHRVYSARARGAFAPRAGQQRQHMGGGQHSRGRVECSARRQDDTNVAGGGKAETVHVLPAPQCTCVLRGACTSAQAGASCKQVGCGEERKQRVDAAHCRHGMEREGSAQQRLPVPPLFKRAHDTCMMQPHVQLAAHNNAAEVVLVQQQQQHTCAAVTCSGFNARTARNASTTSAPPQHSAAASSKVT